MYMISLFIGRLDLEHGIKIKTIILIAKSRSPALIIQMIRSLKYFINSLPNESSILKEIFLIYSKRRDWSPTDAESIFVAIKKTFDPNIMD